MKYIPGIYLVLMPYLIIWMLFLALENRNDTILLIIFLVLSVVCFIFGVLSCVACNVLSVTLLNDTESATRNLMVKVCHIPAHLLILFNLLVFMNPFLMVLSWMPLVCSAGLLVCSGAANICACIKLAAGKKCSVKAAVAFGILSFIGIPDIVSAFVQLLKSY